MTSVSTYYQILFWVVILFGAGVVFKLGSFLVMNQMRGWFEEPKPDAKPAHPPLDRRTHLIWLAMGGYLVLSGLVQLLPQMALVDRTTLNHLMWSSHNTMALTGPWVTLWVSHPIRYNILSGIIQLTVGTFLMSNPKTLTGRIFAIIGGVFALIIAVAGQALGGLILTSGSWFIGVPGSGFIVAGLVLALIWDRMDDAIHKQGASFWTIFWLVGALWQAVHVNFWRATGWARVLRLRHIPTEAGWLLTPAHAVRNLGLHKPVVMNLLVIVAMLLIGLWGRRPPLGRWIGTGLLFVFWWAGQDLGLRAGYGLNLNAAPLEILFLWCWASGKSSSSHTGRRTTPQDS